MTSPFSRTFDILLKTTKIKGSKVSKKDYEQFRNEYIFDAIQGKSFGSAFCDRFDITDYLLLVKWENQYLLEEYIDKIHIKYEKEIH